MSKIMDNTVVEVGYIPKRKAFFVLPGGRCLAVDEEVSGSIIELGGTPVSYGEYVLILQKQKSPRKNLRDELFTQK